MTQSAKRELLCFFTRRSPRGAEAQKYCEHGVGREALTQILVALTGIVVSDD
jgi:hypothetical protein